MGPLPPLEEDPFFQIIGAFSGPGGNAAEEDDNDQLRPRRVLAVSFETMREQRIDSAMTFDGDFEAAGFQVLRA